METRLGEDRANIIRNAICNDNFAVGSNEWLMEHHVERDEFEAFLNYATRLAAMYDWQENNMDVGSVEVEIRFASSSSKVSDLETKWTAFIDKTMSQKVDMIAQDGPVRAVLTPKQMVIPMSDDLATVDTFTGEFV